MKPLPLAKSLRKAEGLNISKTWISFEPRRGAATLGAPLVMHMHLLIGIHAWKLKKAARGHAKLDGMDWNHEVPTTHLEI